MADDETDELRAEQLRRGDAETRAPARRRPARRAEERAEERRAERAAYLKEKLDERAESEERVGDFP